jgi:hypothetical protein
MIKSIDIYINDWVDFKDLDWLPREIEYHGGMCEVYVEVDRYDTHTKRVVDGLTKVCRSYDVSLSCFDRGSKKTITLN